MPDTAATDLTPTDLHARTDAIAAVERCLGSCLRCADADLADGTPELLRCARRCWDTADVAAFVLRLVHRPAADPTLVAGALRLLTSAAESCAAECRLHAEHHDHCADCAEACARVGAAAEFLGDTLQPQAAS